MKQHTRIYLKEMGLDETDFISCEICGVEAVDIHHIEARGMGGSKKKNEVENLIALCRKHHIEYGDKKQHVEYLKKTHWQNILSIK